MLPRKIRFHGRRLRSDPPAHLPFSRQTESPVSLKPNTFDSCYQRCTVGAGTESGELHTASSAGSSLSINDSARRDALAETPAVAGRNDRSLPTAGGELQTRPFQDDGQGEGGTEGNREKHQ